MPFYALVQPPGVLHLVPAEPPRDQRLLRLSQRFNLRNEYVKNMLGLDHKRARAEHKSCQKLDKVQWLEHVTTGELVPVVGEIKQFLATARAKQEDMRFDERSLQQLLSENGKLNGSGEVTEQYKGWRKVDDLQVRMKSTKTRSSPRRFWNSRSRSSILNGAPMRQLAMHWATVE